MLDRRSLLKNTAAIAAYAAMPVSTRAAEQQTLRSAALSRGLLYGTAVGAKLLNSDPLYRDLVAKQAGILVCESESKRKVLQPTQDTFNFGPADTIWRFAATNGQKMRGHTLIWHDYNPDWVVDALARKPSERIITDYISTVARRYRGRTHSWDVVNEVINIEEKYPDFMRRSSPWYQAFGESYIDIAFHAAKEADPDAILFLNELNPEADERWSANIRRGTLDLIDRLLRRNVPIEAVGIQAHLKVFRTSYNDDVFSKFLDEIIARGLMVMITELDITDIDGPADPEVRDEAVASLAKRFLDVAFSKEQSLGCLTWGITDRYSWLNSHWKYKHPDGRISRSLPFDTNYSPKAMFSAMVSAYSAAPTRS